MVSSLRHTIYKNFGKIDYIHYFRRMIRDYEARKWDFDVRTIVKRIKTEIPCPKYVCKREFSKRLCLTIMDEKLFIKEFDRYFNGYIRPAQELRKYRILARRIFVKNTDILLDIIKIVQEQIIIVGNVIADMNAIYQEN